MPLQTPAPTGPADKPALHWQPWLLAQWTRRGPWACLLWPLSWVYGALWTLWRSTFRLGLQTQGHPGVPVLVVGNVVAGGAGKTPTTVAVVRHLQSLGLQVGVVSRGHGRRSRGVQAVALHSQAGDVGDEPLLLKQHTGSPVWVGRDRLAAAMALRQAHPEVQLLVCDDGLQHLRLQRDWELCVMDDRGPGNGWLLPAGPLREPWPRQADWLLYTDGQTRPGAFSARRTLAKEAVNGWGQSRPLADWRGQTVHAFAGIARPERFFAMLQDQGLLLGSRQAWPDHHGFEDWEPPVDDRPVFCTEKDAVKIWADHPDVWAVPLQLEPEPAFWLALEQALQARGLLPQRP